MPNRDGTGPRGEGPQTGAKMGKCQGSKNVPLLKRNQTAGCRQHRGLGNGWKKYNSENQIDR